MRRLLSTLNLNVNYIVVITIITAIKCLLISPYKIIIVFVFFSETNKRNLSRNVIDFKSFRYYSIHCTYHYLQHIK